MHLSLSLPFYLLQVVGDECLWVCCEESQYTNRKSHFCLIQFAALNETSIFNPLRCMFRLTFVLFMNFQKNFIHAEIQTHMYL